MPAFDELLLDALKQSPPKNLADLASFFERSRARVELSLDKGQVLGAERDAYMRQFEEGVERAQQHYFDALLAAEKTAADQMRAKAWYRNPVPLVVCAGLFLAGIALGVVL